jgi:hypothetical protein
MEGFMDSAPCPHDRALFFPRYFAAYVLEPQIVVEFATDTEC